MEPGMVPKPVKSLYRVPVQSFSAPTSGPEGVWMGVLDPNGHQNPYKMDPQIIQQNNQTDYGNQVKHLKKTIDYVAETKTKCRSS